MAARDTTLDGVSVTGGSTVVGIDAGGKVLPVSAIRLADNSDIAAGNPLPTHDALLQTLIAALLPSALVSGRLDVHVGAVTGYTQPVSNSFFDVPFSDLATEITLESVVANTAAILAALQAALPIPTGASTAARQDTGNTSLASILTGLSSLATSAAQTTAQTTLAAIATALGPLATQTTVAAILTALQGTLTTALPTGASTAANQATGNTSLASILAALQGALTVGLPSGAATSAAQGTGNTTLASILSGLGGVVLAAGSAVIGHVITDSGSTTAVSSSALPSGAATSAAQTTAQTSLSSIATSVATDATNTTAIATSTATAATQTTSTATNTGTTATNTGTISTTLSSILAKFTDGLQRAGILGKDGSTLSSATNGVAVAPETSSVWDVKDRLARALGLLTGGDATTAMSLTNGLPVQPQTSSTWNVSDRAARLLGALTGVNGSGIATGANPVPVQLSDGAAVFAFPIRYSGTSLIIAGVQLRTGKGIITAMFWANATGGAVPFMLFDSVGTPSTGAIPIYGVAIAVNGSQTVNTAAISFTSGLWLAVNTGTTITPTYSAAAGTTTSISYNIGVQ